MSLKPPTQPQGAPQPFGMGETRAYGNPFMHQGLMQPHPVMQQMMQHPAVQQFMAQSQQQPAAPQQFLPQQQPPTGMAPQATTPAPIQMGAFKFQFPQG